MNFVPRANLSFHQLALNLKLGYSILEIRTPREVVHEEEV
jgi:hypothetical protein